MRVENHDIRAFVLVPSEAEVENEVFVDQKFEVLFGDGIVPEVVDALE